MNTSLDHLFEIASQPEKYIIGLMSGTSLDGLDIALCRIAGQGADTVLTLEQFKTVAYPEDIAGTLQAVVSVRQADMERLCLLHTQLADYHAECVLEALQEWGVEPVQVHCIASHGQTVYHAPRSLHGLEHGPNATLQIGDGDHLARRTGILTISDFRQKHTAAGGEGAPLAALTDELLFRHDSEARLLLNIGGIANFTYLPPSGGGKVLTTDTGPGNTLINAAMQDRFGRPYDEDGAVAARGSVHAPLARALKQDPFFGLAMPRTTGPERFNLEWVDRRKRDAGIGDISGEDLVATLTWLSARTIADAIREVAGNEEPAVYVSGGGMHNRRLKQWIGELLERPIHSFSEVGFNPDAKEAACFAVLANETLSGQAFTVEPKQNAGRRVNLGKISLPV